MLSSNCRQIKNGNIKTMFTLCWSFFFFIQIAVCEHFINKFAVHTPKGHGAAKKLARDHGYIFHGQIGSMENYFLLEHPHVHRRSASHNQEHHEKLSVHSEVHWFEQQRVVSRKKRDFQPIPSSLVHVEGLNEGHRRVRRDAGRPIMEFNDELYNKMWYFNGGGLNHTDMNVQGAWRRGITGKDVVITILDDGIERNHEDLVDNYDPYASYDVNNNDNDPMPRYDYTNENRHGTRCAGEVSAKANNSKCIVGVAYNSKIGGIRMLDGDVYDAVEAASLTHNRSHVDIYSASWGPDDDGRVVDGPGPLAKKAFIDGVIQGRNGKGSIFVWASGNGGNQQDSCNCDGYTNSIYTLSISSISEQGLKPWYLEECSSTLATTYSSGSYSEKQIISVDLHNRCTETHTGTSASAPLAAGIVALILEINPGLTWRDVQYITLMTSRPLPNGEWVTNGVGRQVSLRYGYGLMDASAMVDLAEKWTNVPAQNICPVKSAQSNVHIPDSGYSEVLNTMACAGSSRAINYLEHTQAKMTIKTKKRGDLVIHLTSPMGTRSTILPQRPNDNDNAKGFKDWEFLSVHFWGENPAGQWKLEIEVVTSNNSPYYGRTGSGSQENILVEWTLVMYGTEENPVNLVKPTIKPPSPRPDTTSGSCHAQCQGDCSGPGADQCDACKSYKMQDSRLCVSSCPNNYYGDEFVCRPCDSTCETCTHVSGQQVMCLKCKAGYLLVEGKGTCVQKCSEGFFKDENLHHCRLCSGMCAECVNSANKCTACRAGQELVANTCLSETVTCQSGQYRTLGGCAKCPAGCISCVNSSSCTCCNKGSYLQNGLCVQSCDSGYQAFHVNYSSKFVFQQCQHCEGNGCGNCPDGFIFINGVCVQQSNCPEGNYFQWNSMSCKMCSTSCRSCIGPSYSDCLSCYPSYGYNNLLRRCLKCCNKELNKDDKSCCNCIEEGKCDLTQNQDEANTSKGLPTLFIIILTIVITALVCFIVVLGCARYMKNKTWKSEITYNRLVNNDLDIHVEEFKD